MMPRAKIALQVDYPGKTDRYYAFRLKQQLTDEPAEYPQPKQMFVVSDIEGNFHSFCKLLLKRNVINKYLKWTFEDGHLVIVGDCFDRGEQVTECLWLIYSLEEQARRKGGYVHFILGNHEIMNMNGDWRYVHPKYAEKTFSQSLHTAIYDGNNELWRWLRTKNIMEKIGDILFVHGGIAPLVNTVPLSITEINQLARPHYTDAEQEFNDPLLSLIFNSQDSPFWYRGYYDGLATEETIDATLSKFKINTIITGHTMVEKVSVYFNGKVINVDTDHANRRSEGLLISKHTQQHHFYRITMDKRRERIK